MDRAIGEEFEYKGKTVKVVEDVKGGLEGCNPCFFNFNGCRHVGDIAGECCEHDRENKGAVHFVDIECGDGCKECDINKERKAQKEKLKELKEANDTITVLQKSLQEAAEKELNSCAVENGLFNAIKDMKKEYEIKDKEWEDKSKADRETIEKLEAALKRKRYYKKKESMSDEDVKKYIKDNLTIKLERTCDYDGKKIKVSLMLENEEIDSSTVYF